MADNTTLDTGSGGDTIRTDDISGVKWPCDKIAYGADGSATLVDGSGNGLPILLKNSSGTEIGTNAAPVQVGDAGGSLTIDGTVAATQSGTWTVQPGNTANTTAWKVDGSAVTQPVSASSLPLPTGASTAAKQPALGTAGTASSDVITVQGVASMTPIQVADNGGSLTVDGTVGISGTVTVGSHAVTNAGTFAVQVDGTALTRLTDIETNTDSCAVVGNGAAATAQRVTLASDSTGIVALTTSTASIGKLAANSGVDIGDVDVTSVPAPLSTAGGGTEATALRVTLASDSTGLVSVDDNGGSLTVDGTVAATQSGTWTVTGAGGTFPVTDSGGSLTVDGTVAVTNAGTFAVQVDGTALTRLTDIETNTDSGAVVGNGAAATAQRVTLANDSTGIVALTTSTASIGKLAANSGVDIGDVDVTSVPAPLSTTGGGTEATALRVTVASDSTGVLSVDDNGSSLTVDNGGTFAVQSADRNGVILRPSITTSASPDYSANDVVSGIVTLSSVMSASGRQAVLKSLVVKDASGQAPALSFMFFRATPSGGTYTDNSALVWGTNDLSNMTGVVRVLTSDWYTLVSKSLAAFGGLDQLMGSANSDLYMLIVADATWNAASTSDLTVELAFEQR